MMRVPYPRASRTALLLSGLLICAPTFAQSSAPADGAPPQVVTITGQVASDLRPYARYRPGIVEFQRYRHLAPAAGLRFGMVTGSFPMKPLPLVEARLERRGLWNGYDERLPIDEDGWFTIPDLPDADETRRQGANVVVSRRNGSSASWMIDVHTPGLPAQVYRLGDLRLECRVYLAIEWDVWHGRRVMGRERRDVRQPPMDDACSGPRGVFVNTRPWPRLQAYVVREGGLAVRHELNGLRIKETSFSLDLAPDDGAPDWSDDALVEFVFYDNSRWIGLPGENQAGRPTRQPTGNKPQ